MNADSLLIRCMPESSVLLFHVQNDLLDKQMRNSGIMKFWKKSSSMMKVWSKERFALLGVVDGNSLTEHLYTDKQASQFPSSKFPAPGRAQSWPWVSGYLQGHNLKRADILMLNLGLISTMDILWNDSSWYKWSRMFLWIWTIEYLD